MRTTVDNTRYTADELRALLTRREFEVFSLAGHGLGM